MDAVRDIVHARVEHAELRRAAVALDADHLARLGREVAGEHPDARVRVDHALAGVTAERVDDALVEHVHLRPVDLDERVRCHPKGHARASAASSTSC